MAFEAYVSNSGDDDVSIIETETFTKVGSDIAVGASPAGLDVGFRGARAYVANGSGTVSTINTITGELVGSPIGQPGGPVDVAVTADSATAYVVNEGANKVSVIDLATNATSEVSVGVSPSAVAVIPKNSTKAYVANRTSNTVSVVDTTTDLVEATIPLAAGSAPSDVVVSLNGTKLYVTNEGNDDVSVFNTSDNSSAAPDIALDAGAAPSAAVVADTEAGLRVFVANRGNDDISVINGVANALVGSDIALDAGANPAAIATTPTWEHLLVANEAHDDVSVFVSATGARLTPDIGVGDAPGGIVTFVAPGSSPPSLIVHRRNAAFEPLQGTIRTKCKGEEKFSELTGEEVLPLGCLIEARRGHVNVTVKTGVDDRTESAELWSGRFTVKQKENQVVKKSVSEAGAETAARTVKVVPTIIRLAGPLRAEGSTSRISETGAETSKKKKTNRKLWGKSKGKFKTKGKKGAATVRGTIWLTEDRPGKTAVKVKRGKVSFRDFINKRTVSLRAGERYVAKKRG